MKNARALCDGMNIILHAFRRRAFGNKYRPDIDVDYESNTDDKNDFDFYTPREVAPRNFISDYWIDTLVNDENEQLDMPNLENKEFAEQKRKNKGEGLKILTPGQMLVNYN